MRNTKYQSAHDQSALAAMFVDYQSLYAAVESRIGKRAYPDEVILEMVAELQRYIARDFGCEIGYCQAFGDFSKLGDHAGHIQRELAHNGIEPRFTPCTIQENAAENVLNFEVGRLIGMNSGESCVVILTGQRVYHVLSNALGQFGKRVIVLPVGMDGEVSDRDVHPLVRYVSASLLLSDAMKKVAGGSASEDNLEDLEVTPSISNREHIQREAVSDAAGLQTLEIVERFFGQYDEVYLTPLLRKLSEVFGEHGPDPKTVINHLEEAGAVWLEKRRGFPYDYTVLILDNEHPDVIRIRQEVQSEESWKDQSEGFSDNGGDDEILNLSPVDSGTSLSEEDTD